MVAPTPIEEPRNAADPPSARMAFGFGAARTEKKAPPSRGAPRCRTRRAEAWRRPLRKAFSTRPMRCLDRSAPKTPRAPSPCPGESHAERGPRARRTRCPYARCGAPARRGARPRCGRGSRRAGCRARRGRSPSWRCASRGSRRAPRRAGRGPAVRRSPPERGAPRPRRRGRPAWPPAARRASSTGSRTSGRGCRTSALA